MQRTKRRLTHSRASASSLSNASTMIRPGSRTSSAGGDCVAISRGFNRYTEIADAKTRIRPTKYSARLALANQKTSKRNRKTIKSRRPKFDTFQNAVVLAPFHTLKKCFQTKLIDLYSHEKLKNLNNKMKMAKKQNVMFEYDVLEVKPPGNSNNRKMSNIKKEATRKKKPAAKKKDKKQVSSSRGQIYCQCDTASSGGKPYYRNAIQSMRAAKQNLKSRVKKNVQTIPEKLSPRIQLPLSLYPSSNSQREKKRRIDNQILASPLLKNDLAFKCSMPNGNLTEGTSNSRTSIVSSKEDSWETFSETPSLQEEHMEGSLAISTTSFDSCMEQSNHNQPRKSYRRYNTRLRMIKSAKDKEPEEVFGFPPKPNTDQSRHLIMNVETRNSDNRINDFLDREPQTQGIVCVDIPQNLQPLPKLSRTKGKKQVPETSSSYYLRSMREVADSKSQTSNQNLNFSQRASQTQKTASNSRRQVDEESKRRRVNQNVNTMDSERRSNVNMVVNKQPQGDKQTHYLFQGTTKTVEESFSQTDETFIPPNANLSEPLKRAPAPAQTPNHNDNRETSFQIIHERRQTPCSPDSDNESEPRTDYGKMDTEKQKEHTWRGNSSEKKFTEENAKETISSGVQLQPGLQEPIKYQGSSSMERASTRMREPLDKESDFIFGPRSNSARLGESCEFTFGLNWVLSDEEDSEHGDRFF